MNNFELFILHCTINSIYLKNQVLFLVHKMIPSWRITWSNRWISKAIQNIGTYPNSESWLLWFIILHSSPTPKIWNLSKVCTRKKCLLISMFLTLSSFGKKKSFFFVWSSPILQSSDPNQAACTWWQQNIYYWIEK